MKKVILSIFAVSFLAGCVNNAQMQPSNQTPANQTPAVQKSGGEVPVTAHSTENQFPPSKMPQNGDATSTTGGSPMARAVDVSAMTADIETAEKVYKQDPKNSKAKEGLAHAYFVRAFALTDAAQYRSALGDFRKGLKLDPDDKEAKDMHDQIISIFKAMGRELPKEGEEPPPKPIQ